METVRRHSFVTRDCHNSTTASYYEAVRAYRANLHLPAFRL
jgi:hypothetical protein